MNDNTFSFTVPGLGQFKSYIEAPLTQMGLFRRQSEAAELVGGRLEWHRMQTFVETHRDSANPEMRQAALSVAIDLMLTNNFCELKAHIYETPPNFSWETVTPRDYERLYAEWSAKRESFRKGEEGRTKEVDRASQTGSEKPTEERRVPERGGQS